MCEPAFLGWESRDTNSTSCSQTDEGRILLPDTQKLKQSCCQKLCQAVNQNVLPGPDLGVVGGAGVVKDDDDPELEMDLLDSNLLGVTGLGLLVVVLQLLDEIFGDIKVQYCQANLPCRTLKILKNN